MDNANLNPQGINEEILDNLVLQVNALEKREAKLPDYHERFSTLESLIIKLLPDQEELAETLKAEIGQHNLAYPAQQIQSQIDVLRNEVARIPKVIPVKNHHHLDLKTKPWIIAGILLLIFASLCTGLNIYLWIANKRLEANDLKFRMTRQMYPKEAKEADAAYARDPSAVEKLTTQYETEALERSEAAGLAEQKEREAKEAKDKLNKLQKHRH